MAKKKIVANSGGIPPEILAKAVEQIRNGLGEAVGFNAFGMPQFPGASGEQVSNTAGLFKNLRWTLVSNLRQLLSELYIEIGLVQTIVDVPVDDAFRGGIEIKSQQLDEDQIAELVVSLDRDDDLNTAGQAAKWNRLFGGAGLIILTDQDPEGELDVEAIGPDTPLAFRAVDLWELYWNEQNTETTTPLAQAENFEHYNYYANKLHKSRVMRLKGFQAPSFIRPRLRGWGFSVVEVLVRSINQYLKATDLGYEVLDEFKLDVYKIKNLVNTLLSPNGQQKIQQRIQIANWQKNYQNAIVMDSEDDFDHKQLSFAGLGDVMTGIRMQVASDLRMPITKLFGQSVSSGLGNNDQNDMENYNSMVEAQVRNKIKYDLLRICELKCQKLFGVIPDDLSIEFKPLRVLTAEQEENVKTQKFTRLIQAKQASEISTFEFREACNKGGLLDITLDTKGDVLNPDDPEVADILEGKDDEEEIDDGATDEGEKKENAGDGWDESKHPRADDGKFGAGAGGAAGEKPAHPKQAEIDKLREEAEKADDSNNTHKAEQLREKARKLEKEGAPKEKKKEKKAEEAPKKKITLKEAKEKGVAWAKHAVEGDIVEIRIKPSEHEEAKTLVGVVDRIMLSERDDGDPDKVSYAIKTGEEDGPRYSGLWNLDKGSSFCKILGVYAKKAKNKLVIMPKAFTRVERVKRALMNSIDYDKAAYEADGGDAWISAGRKQFFENPADASLWAQAKEESVRAYGEERWQFTVWLYKKQGGKFA